MKLLVEILDEINEEPSKLARHASNGALRMLYEYALDPTKKFLLPEGTPPFKSDTAPLSMTLSNLMYEVRRLYIFCRADLTSVRREQHFIQMLEAFHPSEAAILIAVKDQKLEKLYPNITRKLLIQYGVLASAFALDEPVEPAPVQSTEVPDGVVAPKKRGRPAKKSVD